MPQSTQHSAIARQSLPAGDSATQKAAPVDTAALNFKPHYAKGFPPRPAISQKGAKLNELPVMELPSAQPAMSYTPSPLHDTGAMLLLLLSVFLVTTSYQKGYKFVENIFHNMFSVRRRENLFDDHTVNEVGIMSVLIFNTGVVEGLLLYYAIGHLMPQLLPSMIGNIFMHVSLFTACAIAFYFLQFALYYVLGFVFGDALSTRLWISGYKASQALLGLLLFPVVVVLLVYPSTLEITLSIAVILYIMARLVFIYKGFRIFFNNLQSVLYFILYLCAVEIVPPILFYAGMIGLCIFLQS